MPTTQHSINRDDANAYIRRFLSIRSEIQDSSLVNQFPDASQKYLKAKSLSFVFYKDQLDDLFDSVADANALRIYIASDPYSTPSLIIVPCKLSADESSVENKLPAPPACGAQYPKIFVTGMGITTFDLGNE